MPRVYDSLLSMARRSLIHLVGIFGCLTFPTSTQAVRLITGDEYAPWVDTALPGGGIATEMVREVFELIGSETVSIESKPWARALYETQQGQHDATFPYVPTLERKQNFLYSAPLFSVRNALFSGAKAPAFRDVVSLKGKTLCRPQGYSIDLVETMLKQVSFEVVRPVGIGNCFRMLVRDRVDVVMTSESVGLLEIRSSPELAAASIKLDIIPEIADELTLHLLAPKSDSDSAALIEKFNEGLTRYEASGLRQKLFDRRLSELPVR